ncbi:radical SAM protein [Evansella cellulosilytica]|uniref:(Formate-C-acetyltransferase)-activating enzyme n=1 Tax=Evansella cellulosilytica (strain ATCC 21833 / DSM 2522 / FERM P-1141 / JCM 9156 / N-4) TaxID=649639 RepID=E6U0C3_EVAC2|nr:radical SAM protein [Evansella cellulosilytica]ADU30239.1 (Formate-C-acetyltransferase)-activating enzyme [Evansella cellulosilytica DSM 2522]
MKGYVHKFKLNLYEYGPGICFTISLQGCPLMCQFCNNPDTWHKRSGLYIGSKLMINEIINYTPYMRTIKNSGVVISGGEPLMQPEFTYALLKQCKKLGLKTTLITSGSLIPNNINEIIDVTDLVILNIKHMNEQEHILLTGHSNRNTIKLAKYLHSESKEMWLRHILLPSVTNNVAHYKELGCLLASLPNVTKFELLPYKKDGELKWEAMGLINPFKSMEAPSTGELQYAEHVIFSAKNHKESLL